MSQTYFTNGKEYFQGIGAIPFEGKDSDNPLAFKFYDPKKLVMGKTMEEHLRFAACYWHTFTGTGADPFGPGTRVFPWDAKSNPMDAAFDRLDAAFEFFTKLGVPYYCFHDVDMAPQGDTVAESEANLQALVDRARTYQDQTGMKLLWGTANLFSHPRYMNGASTNPDFNVLARGASQVKAAIDATVKLDGENYVFWGGREGYAYLFNTDTKRELDNMGQFLRMARDYGRSIGFEGKFLIEPKPMEPMYHQYDVDTQTVVGFLHAQGLADDFALNIEANHATLAGHTNAHELQMCADAGMLGSIDANRGNGQNGWDTDQFPTDLNDCIQSMLVVLNDGGFKTGGLNFDAKLRRESTDLEDLFIAHIGGMDAYAKGLEVAAKIIESSGIVERKQARYASYENGMGERFTNGELTLGDLRDYAAENGEPETISGKQEAIENIINTYMFRD